MSCRRIRGFVFCFCRNRGFHARLFAVAVSTAYDVRMIVEELKVEFHLTLSEVNLILAALSELPFKVSFELIQKIKQQGEQQVAAAQSHSGATDVPSPESQKH
jgi:hypothetical protein